MKSSDFYCKRHILAWIHVVWATLREDRLGVWSPGVGRKKVRKSREAPIGMMCPTRLALPRSNWTEREVNRASSSWRTIPPLDLVAWRWLASPDVYSCAILSLSPLAMYPTESDFYRFLQRLKNINCHTNAFGIYRSRKITLNFFSCS